MHVTLNIKLLKHGHVNKNIYLALSHFFLNNIMLSFIWEV